LLGFSSLSDESSPYGLTRLGDDEAVLAYDPADVELVNGIGIAGSGLPRKRLFQFFKGYGYSFCTVVHHNAIVDRNVRIGEGTQVMAGAIIQPFSAVGANTIINTTSVVEHDCIVGDHCHVAPKSLLCGSVSIGDDCFIGAGSTILQNIEVGSEVVIGAGSLVLKNIASRKKGFGAPFREVSEWQSGEML